jgi:hypothetical protein
MENIKQKEFTDNNANNAGSDTMAKLIFETFTEILKTAIPDINMEKLLESMAVVREIEPFLDDVKK